MVLLSQASASSCTSAGAVDATGKEDMINCSLILNTRVIHCSGINLPPCKEITSYRGKDGVSYQIQLSLTAALWS